MNAEEIVDNAKGKYANCQTYQDCGEVTGLGMPVLFRTFFVRPNKFRFDWGFSYHSKNAGKSIWSNGLEAYFRESDSDEPQIEESLEMAVASATGVSMGAAHQIAILLMPELSPGSHVLLELRPLSLLQTTQEDDITNHHLSLNGGEDEAWIRQSDYEICETTWKLKTEKFKAKHELVVYVRTFYETIQFDEKIDHSNFELSVKS